MPDRPRVLVASPDPTETATLAEWLLADGLDPVCRVTAQAVAEELRDHACALMVADAGLLARSSLLRAELRTRSPLTPTILLGDAAAPPREGVSGHNVYLARPLERALFTCFVSMALIEGRPRRRSVRKPVNRFDAVVNGVPSHIVDVSIEGLRLEVSRDRRAVLPPHFDLQIPMAGLSVTVRRMWTRPSSTRPSIMWYGGALSQNKGGDSRKWQRFVEALPVGTQMTAL